MLCRWKTSAVPLVWFRSLSHLSQSKQARGSMGSDRCISGGFSVAVAHPLRFLAGKALLFLVKMELASGKYSHHNVFIMVCMIWFSNSIVAVAAVTFLLHEFLSVGPTISPGCINPGHLIRDRPQIAIICYGNIVHNGTTLHIPHQIEQYSKARLVDSMVHCPNGMWIIVYSIAWNPHHQIHRLLLTMAIYYEESG